MAASTILRRALLYVPASSERMLHKSRTLRVDSICYDLEDSVTPLAKDGARTALRQFLQKERSLHVREQAVRINAVSTGLAEADLAAVLDQANVSAIVVPKVQAAADLRFVTDAIDHAVTKHGRPRPPLILALIESARAIMDLNAICASSPYLSGLIFAAEDFALDLSLQRTPALTEMLYARSALVVAARAHNLPSAIDLVCTAFRGEEAANILKDECQNGKQLGFNGKQCIHPDQVDAVQRAFAPSEAELVWAVRIMVGGQKAKAQGRGAWTLDGKMIDAPVEGKAKAIVDKARACNLDVEVLLDKWQGQTPD